MGVRAGIASVVLLMAAWASLASTPPPIHIRGHVFDAETKKPLPDARVGVFLIPAGPGLPEDPERLADLVRVDPTIAYDGSFDVTVPERVGPGSEVYVFAQAPAHAEWVMRDYPKEYADEHSVTLGTTDVAVLIPLRSGRTLEGFVGDAEGKPIAGARVHLLDAGPDWSSAPENHFGWEAPWAWPGNVVSDEQGRWRILGFPFEKSQSAYGGRWVLVIEHDLFAPLTIEKIEALPAPDGVASIHSTLKPGRTLRGVVIDPVGAPVAAAKLMAGWRRSTPVSYHLSHKGTSDEHGQFELRGLLEEHDRLFVEARGMKRAIVPIEIAKPEGARLTVRLEAGASLHGRLLRADGRPLPWTHLNVSSPGAGNYSGGAVSGVDGTFELFGMDSGAIEIRPVWDRLFPLRHVTLPSPDVEIRIPSRRALIVELLDRATGKPASTAGTVSLLGPTGEDWIPFDPSSRVPFGLVCPGNYTLRVRTDEFMPLAQAITMSPGPGQQVVRLQLSHGFALSGRVTDTAGRPVAGAEVYLEGTGSEGHRGITDDDGRYRVAGLSDTKALVGNAYIFFVHAKGKAPALDFQTFAAFSPFQRTHDFVLESGGTIRGRVARPDGTPVDGAVVRAYEKKYFVKVPVPLVTDTTDADGRYELRNVPSGSIVVNAGGEETTLDVDNLETRDLNVTVPAKGTPVPK